MGSDRQTAGAQHTLGCVSRRIERRQSLSPAFVANPGGAKVDMALELAERCNR